MAFFFFLESPLMASAGLINLDSLAAASSSWRVVNMSSPSSLDSDSSLNTDPPFLIKRNLVFFLNFLPTLLDFFLNFAPPLLDFLLNFVLLLLIHLIELKFFFYN